MKVNEIAYEMANRTGANQVRVFDLDDQEQVEQAMVDLNRDSQTYKYEPFTLNGWCGIVKLKK